jgi:hypothetical protein
LPGKKELRRDVFGELALKILFATAPAPTGTADKDKSAKVEEVAETAAAGWGGDRMVAFADPANATAPATVIDDSVWDTEGDAKEAEAVARRLMQKLADGDAAHDDWIVTREGDKLVLVFGAPAGTGSAVAAEALKSWKVARP